MRSFVIDDQPLFLTQSALGEMEKVANFKLNRDPAKWEQEVMGFLHEEHPYLQTFQDIKLHLNRTDADTGTGVGQIVLNGKVAIPLIIEEFKLQPLDLFWYDGKLNAMTKPSILGALQETGVGKAIDKGVGEIADMSMYTDTQPPHLGRYAYASSLDFTLDELNKAMEEMGRDGLEFALKTSNPFKKVAAAYAANAKDEHLKKEAGATTFRTGAIEFDRYDPIEKAGVYTVLAGGMEKKAGFVFDNIIDFNDRVLEGYHLFAGFDGNYALSDREFGGAPIHGRDVRELEKAAMDSDPRESKFGFFWMVKEGKAIATIPMRVMYSGTDEDQISFLKIASATPDGAAYRVYPSDEFDGLTVVDDQVFMGPAWHWSTLKGEEKLATADAANKIGWPTDSAELRCKNSRFYMDGIDIPELHRAGETAENFFKIAEAKFDGIELLELMKTAEDNGSAFFRFEENVPAAPAPPYLRFGGINLIKEATFIRPTDKTHEFFKFAVSVKEDEAEQTVDSILGLNFITDENLHKFIENLDTLESSVHIVAKLLLASRLGLRIEQSPLRTALFAMDDVVRQLRQMRNTAQGNEE